MVCPRPSARTGEPARYSVLCVPLQYGGYFVRLQQHSHFFSAAVSLALFVWLLTPHPAAAGRVYAAYTLWDLTGAAVAIAGMAIIMFAPRPQ